HGTHEALSTAAGFVKPRRRGARLRPGPLRGAARQYKPSRRADAERGPGGPAGLRAGPPVAGPATDVARPPVGGAAATRRASPALVPGGSAAGGRGRPAAGPGLLCPRPPGRG